MTLQRGVAGGEGRRARGRGGLRRLVEMLSLLLRGLLYRIRIAKREVHTCIPIVWGATHLPCFGGRCCLLFRLFWCDGWLVNVSALGLAEHQQKGHNGVFSFCFH